ncbi:MAG: glycoside hydrolase family 3 [Rhodobacteraceae bacterium]|nr:glycoside hydrolase family 3 [Paracoccaceae bacterium]
MTQTRRHFLHAASATMLSVLAAPAIAQADPVRRAGARILVGFAGTRARDAGVQAVARDLAAGRVAGVVLFQRNIRSARQLRRLLDVLRDAGGATPPIITIDNEGGPTTRTNDARGFKSWLAAQQVVARCDSEDCVYDYYKPRAAQLAKAGITLNLAPVTDLNVNPRNPIIGGLGRSFSADPRVVTAAARQFIWAHRAAGLATCLKHFPGHGSTTDDSHLGLPDITQSWSAVELDPFAKLVGEGLADSVMMAHLFHENLSDGRFQPTSLSQKAIGVLRHEIGFDGPVITDDLQMGAVRNAYDEAASVHQAIAAGNDLLIFGNFANPDAGLGARINSAVQGALAGGAISDQAMAQSERRIETLRQS